ncbi:PC-esterase domain-containing protein 1A isoform X2 [Brienomyrus brachyistius]|uniref:PC-esterase domain-containing protein 1A isoform X2 n=1 Tax=Brienomyrus brachyistius TaxID=42636 RepID=UPI0020B2166D|nr:PC-esterase domain-containing protein 1A isoform X2 [Brienomyrus brachyistius]
MDVMKWVTQSQASRLLHNKFVVVLGDSIQRSVYKDLVLLLQKDAYLSQSQLRNKGEMSFEQDALVEGGQLETMHNGTGYREVRQYRSDHHLLRFYFITRIYSCYMESILADLENSLKPDVLILNSCLWDVSRYSRNWAPDYRENLQKLFSHLKRVLHPECLVLWNMTMPLGKRIVGGFLVPEIQDLASMLRHDVIEANFFSATLADAYGLDVLDLHFHFRFLLQHRVRDGVHWNALAHRRISSLLLEHAAQAWGVELHQPGQSTDPGETAGQQLTITVLDTPRLTSLKDPGSQSGSRGVKRHVRAPPSSSSQQTHGPTRHSGYKPHPYRGWSPWQQSSFMHGNNRYAGPIQFFQQNPAPLLFSYAGPWNPYPPAGLPPARPAPQISSCFPRNRAEDGYVMRRQRQARTPISPYARRKARPGHRS